MNLETAMDLLFSPMGIKKSSFRLRQKEDFPDTTLYNASLFLKEILYFFVCYHLFIKNISTRLR